MELEFEYFHQIYLALIISKTNKSITMVAMMNQKPANHNESTEFAGDIFNNYFQDTDLRLPCFSKLKK